MPNKPAAQRRGRGKSHGPTNSAPRTPASAGSPALDADAPAPVPTVQLGSGKLPTEASQDDSDVCYICANSIVYYSVGPCNHRTCHICALRLRALYKNTNCAFCKEDQATLIFTSSSDALFASYSPDAISWKDAKLNIYFEKEQMLEETLILLRFNCPDSSCDYVGRGWGDLGLHTRSVHGRLLCDLCVSNKKVFAHEHTLYTAQQLVVHLPEGGKRRGPRNNRPREGDVLEGDQPHPACLFCNRCFFGPDELYRHMREIHEDCFICKRDQGSSEYFRDYPSLESHFNTAHYPCTHKNCQAAKFVVFSTELDLRAHVVGEHAEEMTAAGIRDARRIEVEFQEVNRDNRGRGRGNPAERGTRRNANSGRDAPPPQRPTAAGGSRRREAFGTSLTTDDAPPTPPPPRPMQPTFHGASTSQGQRSTDIDPAILALHSEFLNLVSFKAGRQSAVPSVQAAIRAWKSGESSARDLISLIHTILDDNLEKTASVINAFLRLLDDDDDDDAEERRREVLKEWRGFEVEQKRQFPSLVETLPESGASTTNRGYAAVTGGRAILAAKHHTAIKGRKKGNVWDRVEQAASSSESFGAGRSSQTVTPRATASAPNVERFPPLGMTGPSSGPSTVKNNTTPWTSSSAAPRPSQPISQPVYHTGTSVNAPKLSSKELFPSLTPSAAASSRDVPKVSGNVSLKNILGSAPPPLSQWGAKVSQGSPSQGPPEPNPPPAKGGKKGKGKQTLFTLGSFPT